MRLVIKQFWIIYFIFLLNGCQSLQSVSQSQIPAKKGNTVKSDRSKFLILGLSFSNAFVNEVTEDLTKQCNNGSIEGILTKVSYTNYFFWIFMTQSVEASGYCMAQGQEA